MKTGFIICTFNRPEPLRELLASVKGQSVLPDQVLIIDGSYNSATKEALKNVYLAQLEYYKVGAEDRGLTRQRNYGVSKLRKDIQIVSFLDDDTVLDENYFSEILKTYSTRPEALGVSGYITNEVQWKKVSRGYTPQKREFLYDGWSRIEGSRFSLRRKFGLAPDVPPGFLPDFSHGYSTGFLPPSGKTYEVEMLMGGIASYRRSVFEEFSFSPYFEGYGLYEDADFSLRVSKRGKLFVNTAAKVEHHHAEAGRPNMFKYGKMVVRNGWYVWRVRHSEPGAAAILKWHSTSFLLTLVRLGNTITGKNKKAAFEESLGRISGWFSLFFNQPNHTQQKAE